jgi:YidC/Oxa1 family membrane protein insertase
MFHFIGQVFNVVIARPIFNLLIIILALIPGHNLGLAIIIFTVIVRLALYPLLKKQLHNAMAMRKLQPDLKRIKKEAAGDRQKESAMMMALYKERGINPFGSVGIIIIQLPILIALYSGIRNIVKNPSSVLDLSYSWLHHLPYLKSLSVDIHRLDTTLFNFLDLTRMPLSNGGVYWPAMILVVASVTVQYLQSKQLMMTDKSSRSMRQILRATSTGEKVDQSEVQAATNRMTLFFIPGILFFVSLSIVPALSLYWFVGGAIAYWQQSRILKRDVIEMEASVDNVKVEAEIITDTTKTKTPKLGEPGYNAKKKTSKKNKHNKRRR